jgi:uncharacterized coiled-coil protein SlyX
VGEGGNVWVTVLAFVGTGVMTLLVTRYGKHHDARGLAEAELLGIGPKIIKEQNDRIASQRDEIDGLWKELQRVVERERKCQSDLIECLFQLRSAQQRIIALEKRLGLPPEEFEPLPPGEVC